MDVIQGCAPVNCQGFGIGIAAGFRHLPEYFHGLFFSASQVIESWRSPPCLPCATTFRELLSAGQTRRGPENPALLYKGGISQPERDNLVLFFGARLFPGAACQLYVQRGSALYRWAETAAAIGAGEVQATASSVLFEDQGAESPGAA